MIGAISSLKLWLWLPRQDVQGEIAGFYRGGPWCRQYLKKPFVPQAIARLKYRGADYFRVALSEQVKRLSLNWL